MRSISIISVFAVFVTVSADATETKRPCPGMLEEKGRVDESPAQGNLPLLTDRQCEALKNRELRVPLLEIPQEDENSMTLSIGVKGSGATFHFKIPFSF